MQSTSSTMPNWVEINLDAFKQNLSYIAQKTNTPILLPVKADAYGHGSLACSFAAQSFGVHSLGVAHTFEAIALRKFGIELPILILGPISTHDFESILKYSLTPSFPDLNSLSQFEAFLQSRKANCNVHLKIDTGMNRYGFPWEDISSWQPFLESKELNIQGIFSHLACSEDPHHPYNSLQINRFQELKDKLSGIDATFHLANSGGVMHYPESYHDLVRPGLISYGYSPTGVNNPKLQSTMQVYAKLRQIKGIHKGDGVSYGQKWQAEKYNTIGAISIGYGDGLPRSSTTPFYHNNKSYQPVGSICMDTTMIDLSEEELNIDSPFQVMGFPENNISIESVAKAAGLISYELTCGIARRMHREYLYNGQHLQWNELKEEFGINHE